MKSIDDLRKAFFGWRQPLSRDNALRGGIETSRILDKLTDPTPITEAGLRELGFVFDDYTKLWEIGEDGGFYSQSSAMLYCHGLRAKNVRTLGHLRMLLLSVGDQ